MILPYSFFILALDSWQIKYNPCVVKLVFTKYKLQNVFYFLYTNFRIWKNLSQTFAQQIVLWLESKQNKWGFLVQCISPNTFGQFCCFNHMTWLYNIQIFCSWHKDKDKLVKSLCSIFLTVGYGVYLIVLVSSGTFINNVCFIKIHVTVAWINWTVFQTKFKPNLIKDLFYKNRWMWYMI